MTARFFPTGFVVGKKIIGCLPKKKNYPADKVAEQGPPDKNSNCGKDLSQNKKRPAAASSNVLDEDYDDFTTSAKKVAKSGYSYLVYAACYNKNY